MLKNGGSVECEGGSGINEGFALFNGSFQSIYLIPYFINLFINLMNK